MGNHHGPTVRRLMKVQIEDAMAADDIFTTLMGTRSNHAAHLSKRMRWWRGILMLISVDGVGNKTAPH